MSDGLAQSSEACGRTGLGSPKRGQAGSVLFGQRLVTLQPRHIEKVGPAELVGLRVVGRRLPGSSVFLELPREVNGRSLHAFPVVSISTDGPEMSTSQEYRSSSHTAVASSESTLPKPQPSGPRKKQELTWGPKVVQVVTDYLNHNFTEIAPASSQRGATKMTKATQGPKSKPRKTEAPKAPSRTTSSTEAPEGPKPSKSRSILTLKERVRRAKAVRAQGWKRKAQSSSQTLTQTSSTIQPDSSESVVSTPNEPPGQTPGPSKPEDSSSLSESTSTNLSHSESFLELTNLLTNDVQEVPGDITPGHYSAPAKGQ